MGLFRPGERCGQYQIVRLIGGGSAAEVYEATGRTREDAAVKILRHDPATAPQLRDRLAQEAESLAMIEHVNVVRFYEIDIEYTWNRVWFSMELVRGLNLRQLLAREGGRLPIQRAVTILRHVCEGVAAAHRHGFVHRDLKPENILVGRDDLAKVSDFGSVKLPGWGVQTAPEQQVGSALYQSPDQLKGAAPDPKDDVYSLGLLLRELITGVHATVPGRANLAQVCMRQLTVVPPPLVTVVPHAPPDVCELLDRALAKDRAERCTARELADGLERAQYWLLAPRRAAARSVPLPNREIGLALTVFDGASWLRGGPPPDLPSSAHAARGGTIPMRAMAEPAPTSGVRETGSTPSATSSIDCAGDRSALVPPPSNDAIVEAPETMRSMRHPVAVQSAAIEALPAPAPVARISSTVPTSTSRPGAAASPAVPSRALRGAVLAIAAVLTVAIAVALNLLLPGRSIRPAALATGASSALASASASAPSSPVAPVAPHASAARSASPVRPTDPRALPRKLRR